MLTKQKSQRQRVGGSVNRIEKNLQTQIKKFCEERGAVVLKTSPGVLNPTGIPDLIIIFKEKWSMIEVKASLTAKKQPLQPIQLARFKDMNPDLVFVACPENWNRIQFLLTQRLFNKAT